MARSRTQPPALTVPEIGALPVFFVSGFVGLVYEIAWIRLASLTFGSATIAMSTVLGVFFGGWAIGSYVFGRRAERWPNPLRLYAWLEIGLGVWGLASPHLMALADGAYGAWYGSLLSSFGALLFVRFLLVSAVLLPPAILMGGTLPLFVQHYASRSQRIAGWVGLLYGLNTLGALAGCAACGFVMIPTMGVRASIYAAAALNFIIGGVVWRWGPRARESTVESLAGDAARGRRATQEPMADARGAAGADEAAVAGARRWVYALFFVVGFTALANEVLWARFLSLLVRNSVHTYTLTLTVILGGIALGALLTARLFDRMRRPGLVFGGLQAAGGLIVFFALTLPAAWWQARADENRLLSIFIGVLLAPAVLSGASFPLAARMAVEDARRSGLRVGGMTAINTLGGIAGSLVIGFLALPRLGLYNSLLLTTGLSLLAGFVAWWRLDASKSVLKLVAMGACFAGWYWIPQVSGTRLPQDYLSSDREKLLDFREGLASHLAVVQLGTTKQLEIDKLWQGENRRTHQIMAAHVPMLLHPGPKRVLGIGIGVGQTFERILLYDVERLDCVDIEPALPDIVKANFDARWMNDPRVRLRVEDGRSYASHTNETYDLISIEVGQTFRPGVSSFYTRDFYRKARQRLRPGGTLCQFVPIAFFSTQEFRNVLATFLSELPQAVLWYNTDELLLIGSADRMPRLTMDRWTEIANRPAVLQDLEFSHWGGPEQWLSGRAAFLGGFLLGPGGLMRVAEGGHVYADDRPELEYATSATGRPDEEHGTVELIRGHLEPIAAVFDGALTTEESAKAQRIRDTNLRDVFTAKLAREALRVKTTGGSAADVLRLLREAVRWNPDDAAAQNLLGSELEGQGKLDEAEQAALTAVQIDPRQFEGQLLLGRLRLKRGNHDGAEGPLQTAARLRPDSADAHAVLGDVLTRQGRFAEAAEHYEAVLRQRQDEGVLRSLQLARAEAAGAGQSEQFYREAVQREPSNPEYHFKFGRALAAKNDADGAMREYQEALRLRPGYWEASINLGVVLLGKGQVDPAAAAFEAGLAQNPKHAPGHYNLAIARYRQGNVEAATKCARDAIAADPTFAQGYYYLGMMLSQKSQWAEAAEALAKAVELNPNYAEAHNNLGRVLLSLGRRDEAVRHFSEAIRIKPDYQNARDNLRLALEGQEAPTGS